jgi:hypothetical protein
MQVIVQTLTGKTITPEVRASFITGNVNAKFQSKVRIAPEQLHNPHGSFVEWKQI